MKAGSCPIDREQSSDFNIPSVSLLSCDVTVTTDLAQWPKSQNLFAAKLQLGKFTSWPLIKWLCLEIYIKKHKD